MKRDALIETLRNRTAWYRKLALAATDPEVTRALLKMASETEAAMRAVQENAYPGNKD